MIAPPLLLERGAYCGAVCSIPILTLSEQGYKRGNVLASSGLPGNVVKIYFLDFLGQGKALIIGAAAGRIHHLLPTRGFG